MLFDDKQLDRHIRSIEKLAPQRAKEKTLKSGSSTGTVTRWVGSFGFIKLDDQAANCGDVFVGSRALGAAGIRSVSAGDKLRFDVVPSRVKAGQHEAANISIIEAA